MQKLVPILKKFHTTNTNASNLVFTHEGLMMPYGDIDLGQHWLR